MRHLYLQTLAAVCAFGVQVGLLPAQESSSPVKVSAVTDVSPTTEPANAATLKEPTSNVRIVRLSQVSGEVQMDRGVGRSYEAAFTNLPVIEQTRLKTGQGTAEVEFEDNSTLRLTPHSFVEFSQLRLTARGATVSSIRVVKGLVYVSCTGNKTNEITLLFGAQHVVLGPSAHIELSVAEPTSRLSVLDGFATVQDSERQASSIVGKKHSLLVDNTPQGNLPVQVAGIERSPYDTWDKTAANFHAHYANTSAFGGSSAGYGTSDLNYYGSFADLPGCGSVWRPYFASTAWDPFGNGTWAFYQGAGYSFVSPYPWGWAPFHTGLWQQCGANGWAWQPQGQWNGLNNRGILRAPLRGKLPQPPRSPEPGQPTLIPLHTRPLITSGLVTSGTFVFSKDSAGLGIPRQTFGKLKSVSSTVAHDGVATTPVAAYAALASSQSEPGGKATSHPLSQADFAHGSALPLTIHKTTASPTSSAASTGTPSTSSSHSPVSAASYSSHASSGTASVSSSSGTSHHN